MHRVVEPGTFTVWLASSSDTGKPVAFEATK
jgi:hypothetical protein